MTDSPGYLVGRQFGNYHLTRLLGQGGFASVYLAEQVHLNTLAAVKVLHTQIAYSETGRFRNEARMIASLDHPHIVRIIDFGIEGSIPYLLMSYAPNGTLRTRHPEGLALPVPIVVEYVKQVADALQYAHDRRLIHRDIKPENILLDAQNNLLLSDFGIALITQTSHQQSTKDVTGTMSYMAPEQLSGKPVAASDQYALGIMTYEWLTGTRPFQGNHMELLAQHLSAPVPPLSQRTSGISFAVEQVVLRALSKNPQERFLHIKDFSDALEAAHQTGQATVYPPISRASQPYPSIPPTKLASAPPIQPAGPFTNNPTQARGSFNSTQSPRRTIPAGPMQTPASYPPDFSTPQPYYSTPPQPYYSPPPSYIQPPVQYIQTPPIVMHPPRKSRVGCWITGTVLGILALTLCAAIGLGATNAFVSLGPKNASATSVTTSIPTPLPVTSDTLYHADWSKGPDGWTGSSWNWIENGTIDSDGATNSQNDYLYHPPFHPSTSNYAIATQIQLIHPLSYDNGFGIFVRSNEKDGSGYYCYVDDTQASIYADPGGSGNSTTLASNPYSADENFHTFRVEIKADKISFFIDGQLMVSTLDGTFQNAGTVGLEAYQSSVKVSSFQVLKLE